MKKNCFGSIYYKNNDNFHRIGLPAISYENTVGGEWLFNNQQHRINGRVDTNPYLILANYLYQYRIFINIGNLVI